MTAHTTVINATMEMIRLLRMVNGGRPARRRAVAPGNGCAGCPAGDWGSVSTVGADSRSRGGFEDITEAPHGVDHRLPSRIDLLPQIRDVQLGDVGLTAEIVVPDPVEDLRLGHG